MSSRGFQKGLYLAGHTLSFVPPLILGFQQLLFQYTPEFKAIEQWPNVPTPTRFWIEERLHSNGISDTRDMIFKQGTLTTPWAAIQNSGIIVGSRVCGLLQRALSQGPLFELSPPARVNNGVISFQNSQKDSVFSIIPESQIWLDHEALHILNQDSNIRALTLFTLPFAIHFSLGFVKSALSRSNRNPKFGFLALPGGLLKLTGTFAGFIGVARWQERKADEHAFRRAIKEQNVIGLQSVYARLNHSYQAYRFLIDSPEELLPHAKFRLPGQKRLFLFLRDKIYWNSYLPERRNINRAYETFPEYLQRHQGAENMLMFCIDVLHPSPRERMEKVREALEILGSEPEI